VTIVGRRDHLLWVMFDKCLKRTQNRQDFIALIRADMIYTGPEVAPYIAMQRARSQPPRTQKEEQGV
jgi:hypothetical protein